MPRENEGGSGGSRGGRERGREGGMGGREERSGVSTFPNFHAEITTRGWKGFYLK